MDCVGQLLLETVMPARKATRDTQNRSTLEKSELLATAEAQRFQVLVTTDTNLQYQQNLTSRRIAIVVRSTTSWPRIKAAVEVVIAAVNAAGAGTHTVVPVP